MKNFVIFIGLLLLFSHCKKEGRNIQLKTFFSQELQNHAKIDPDGATVQTRILVPDGYKRVESKENSFALYLQNFPLKSHGSEVHLYNGKLKYRQDVHVAVLDISVGNRDLQQCADATMRLRAEYLYGQKQYGKIHFNFTNGFKADYQTWRNGNRISVSGNTVKWISTTKKSDTYQSFMDYMTMVFSYAGTLSLSRELPKVRIEDIQIGDVFIQGGSPGHAVLVMDIAQNTQGEKIVLLAQSYMPAQEIHILKNSEKAELSPWYEMKNLESLATPEWKFTKDDLKRWK